jgi:phosphoribosylanthranilate isomerase
MHASDCGADAIGLVFYPPSPRNIDDLALAIDIAQSVGPFVDVVGLFVNAEEHFVESVLSKVPLNCLQFHGEETAAYCEQFSRPFYKALRMKPGMDTVETAAQYASARGVLLDTYVKGVPGGTGQSFNWDHVPASLKNVVLAGGLNPENVAKAVSVVRPYAVDVSGGVEASRGIKDPLKVQTFIANAKLEQLS